VGRPSGQLLAEVFAGVPARRELAGFGSVLSIERARGVLGYQPAHTWRTTWPRSEVVASTIAG
jgi:hypothetical protein